jgi:beta-glucosidase
LIKRLHFPEDFVWGSAASAYQIEGAHNEDGKGDSIWDRFCRTPGNVANNDTGDVACDHYHRYREDVELMATLGLQAYRFSISWTRVLPKGKGGVNQAGLDFYRRLVDLLLDAGIIPMVTLYAWDLPQTLQDEGGWANRDTAKYFQDYASIVYQALEDRVHLWSTINEPWVIAFGGHYYGLLAPGMKDAETALQVSHHLLLAHGQAVQTLREMGDERCKIGIILNLTPIHRASEGAKDREAADRLDGYMNRWFLDPIFVGNYPADMLTWYGDKVPAIEPEDMKTISNEIDYLGVNYYTRLMVEAFPGETLIGSRSIPVEGAEYTETSWEVYPQGLYEILIRLRDEYQPPAIYITENGANFSDEVDEAGQINDLKRIAFLQDHLLQAHRAIEEGVPLFGYFVWSVMDLFEWDSGYSHRYGLIHVNRATLERKVKRSGLWYKQFIQQRKLISEVL